MIRNDEVEELRAEGLSVARFKTVHASYVVRTKERFLGLDRLSFIMHSIQISIFPSTIFLSLFP